MCGQKSTGDVNATADGMEFSVAERYKLAFFRVTRNVSAVEERHANSQ